MSRTSHVPYHQNVYDLFDVVRVERLAEPADRIAGWEHQTGRHFPAAMAEFYTTSVTLRLSGGDQRDWTLTLPELWSEFSNDERARSVPEVLGHYVPPPWSRSPGPPVPSFDLIHENQGNWVMCARDDGSDDPVIDVSGPSFLSPVEIWERAEYRWHSLGTFREVLCAWFAAYYLEVFTPLSFDSHNLPDSERMHGELLKPHINGLWLRTPAEPFTPPVIDYLMEQVGEPERTARLGDVTTYTFRSPGGTIRVTADEPSLPGGLSAWWLHADTPDHLAELARLVLPFGTLRDTLRADTDPAREVLRGIL